jgi:phage shock protein C
MAKKLLYKSNDDKKWDGVCAGVAEYFDIDPTLVRAGYVFITVITGVVPGLFAYLALSWIMPRKTEVKA